MSNELILSLQYLLGVRQVDLKNAKLSDICDDIIFNKGNNTTKKLDVSEINYLKQCEGKFCFCLKSQFVEAYCKYFDKTIFSPKCAYTFESWGVTLHNFFTDKGANKLRNMKIDAVYRHMINICPTLNYEYASNMYALSYVNIPLVYGDEVSFQHILHINLESKCRYSKESYESFIQNCTCFIFDFFFAENYIYEKKNNFEYVYLRFKNNIILKSKEKEKDAYEKVLNDLIKMTEIIFDERTDVYNILNMRLSPKSEIINIHTIEDMTKVPICEIILFSLLQYLKSIDKIKIQKANQIIEKSNDSNENNTDNQIITDNYNYPKCYIVCKCQKNTLCFENFDYKLCVFCRFWNFSKLDSAKYTLREHLQIFKAVYAKYKANEST